MICFICGKEVDENKFYYDIAVWAKDLKTQYTRKVYPAHKECWDEEFEKMVKKEVKNGK